MNLTLNSKSAGNIAVILIAVRTFTAVTLDGHEYLNSGWLCTILGCILALPLAITADKHAFTINCNTGLIGKITAVTFSVLLAYESAFISRLLVNTVSYSNLQTIPVIILSSIIYVAAIYIISKNGAGIGNASKLWIICMVVLGIAVMMACFSDLHLKWITPIFGPEIQKLIEGTVAAAGHISSGFLLILSSERDKKCTCTRSVLIGSAIACLMCVYWSLMMPVQLSNHMNRLTGIELLLSNGRTSLAVLLPMALIWFMYLIAAMYGYSFASAVFLQSVFRNSKLYSTAAITSLASFVLANTGAAESNIDDLLSKYIYIVLVLLLIINFISSSGKRTVKNVL